MKVLRSNKWRVEGVISGLVAMRSLERVNDLILCDQVKFVDVANDLVYFITSGPNGQLNKELSYASQRKLSSERASVTLKAMS